jgi:hypothetical protein
MPLLTGNFSVAEAPADGVFDYWSERVARSREIEKNMCQGHAKHVECDEASQRDGRSTTSLE